MRIPASLTHLGTDRAGNQWLTELPGLVAACAAQWDLEIEEPYDDAHLALVMPATTGAGDRVVLKIQYPHRESSAEGMALRVWSGRGAVSLIAEDPGRHALLLERCIPGTHLSSHEPEFALGVIVGLLPRLWVPATGDFGTLADEVAHWIGNLPGEWAEAGRPFQRSLLDRALAELGELAGSQGEQILLHQDLHGDNILAAAREPWLAIDPKPLIGEREFGLSPIIRSCELGRRKEDVRYRLDRLTGELGLDRERARQWAFGHAIAWGFEDGRVLPEHIETARLLLDA